MKIIIAAIFSVKFKAVRNHFRQLIFYYFLAVTINPS